MSQRLAEHKARQALTYVHSRSRRPSGAAMRMVRPPRDASKQDEARELLAPVHRSVEPRPSSSLIHRQCLDRSFLCDRNILRCINTRIDPAGARMCIHLHQICPHGLTRNVQDRRLKPPRYQASIG